MPKAFRIIAVVCFVVFLFMFVFRDEPDIADPPTGESFFYVHPFLNLMICALFFLWLLTSVWVSLHGLLTTLNHWSDRKLRNTHLVASGLALPGIVYFVYGLMTSAW